MFIALKAIYNGPAAKNMSFNSWNLIEIKDLLLLASPEGFWSISQSCTFAIYLSYLKWQQFKSMILDTVTCNIVHAD